MMFIMLLKSVPLPDLTLTLPDNNTLSIFIFIRLFLTHNPPRQTPLTVSLSGVRYLLDLSIAHLESQAHIFLYPRKIQAGVKIIAVFIVTRWHASLVRSTQCWKVYIVDTWEKFTMNGFQMQKKSSWINKRCRSLDMETLQIMFCGRLSLSGGQDHLMG